MRGWLLSSLNRSCGSALLWECLAELVTVRLVPYVSIYTGYISPPSALLLIVYLPFRGDIGFSSANALLSKKKLLLFSHSSEQAGSHKVVTNRKPRVRKATALDARFTKSCALGLIRQEAG